MENERINKLLSKLETREKLFVNDGITQESIEIITVLQKELEEAYICLRIMKEASATLREAHGIYKDLVKENQK